MGQFVFSESLRFAVMEAESWVPADARGFSNYLGLQAGRIPRNPDEIPNPKEFIVSLGRKVRRKKLREDLVPKYGATSNVGPSYNDRLTEFVYTQWDMQAAMIASPSLRRTVERLTALRESA